MIYGASPSAPDHMLAGGAPERRNRRTGTGARLTAIGCVRSGDPPESSSIVDLGNANFMTVLRPLLL